MLITKNLSLLNFSLDKYSKVKYYILRLSPSIISIGSPISHSYFKFVLGFISLFTNNILLNYSR